MAADERWTTSDWVTQVAAGAVAVPMAVIQASLGTALLIGGAVLEAAWVALNRVAGNTARTEAILSTLQQTRHRPRARPDRGPGWDTTARPPWGEAAEGVDDLQWVVWPDLRSAAEWADQSLSFDWRVLTRQID